jgi:hypothetical protein
VGGSNGTLYQLSLTTGAIQKTLTVGGGTLSVGPVSFSPDGSLYQRFPGAFTANGRPLSVTNRLLVNGTAIVDAGLYGQWCVDLFLDQEEAPIARRGFVLTAP